MNSIDQMKNFILLTETPEPPKNDPDSVSISIPKRHFDLLSRWASVSRTFDKARTLIDNYAGSFPQDADIQDECYHCEKELSDLQPALDDVNAICKHTRISGEIGKKSVESIFEGIEKNSEKKLLLEKLNDLSEKWSAYFKNSDESKPYYSDGYVDALDKASLDLKMILNKFGEF